MKIFFVTAIFAALTIMGQSIAQTDENMEAVIGMPYVDKNGFFSFTPPTGWARRDYPDEPRSKVQYTDPHSRAYIRLIVRAAEDEVTAQNFVSTKREDMQYMRERMSTHIRSMTDRAGTFHNYPALYVRISVRNEEEAEQIFFLAGNVQFNIWYGAPDATTLEAKRALVTNSLDSIVVKGKAGAGQSKEHGVANALRLAQLFSQNNDLVNARRELEEALRQYPRDERLTKALESVKREQPIAWDQSLRDYGNAGKEKFTHSDFHGARTQWELGLAVARKQGNRRAIGYLLNSLGMVYRPLGDYPQALRYYEQGLAITRDLGDRAEEAQALNNLGVVFQFMGDYPQALRHYEQSLSIKRDLGDRPGEGKTLNNLGSVYKDLGDYPQALRHYEQAIAIKRELGDWHGQGKITILGNLGNIYVDLGDYPQALRHYEQGLAIARDLGDQLLLANTLNGLGFIHEDLGDHSQALHHLEQALAIYKTLGVNPGIRSTEGNLGDVYLAQGQLPEALAIFQRVNDPGRLGRYYLRVGSYDKARAAFTGSLKEEDEQRRNAEFLLADYIGLGLAYEGLKDYVQAKTYYQKAVDFIERQREGLTESQRRYFFAAKVGGFSRLEPYEGLVRVSSHLNDPAMAFHWAEHTKARLLLDAVARRYRDNAPGLPDADLAHQEAELDQQLVSTYKQLDLAFQKNNAERRQALEQELPGLKQKQQALIARLRQQYPAYAAIRYPQPLRLEELKLDPHEALIEYEVTDSVTYAWLIKDNQIRKTLTIPLGRAALTEQIKRYRGFCDISNPAQLNQFDPRLGQELYVHLFKDFAPLLDQNDRIILVPDEILGILPFEALVVEAPTQPKLVEGKPGRGPTWPGVRYLGERLALRYAQSASALQQGQHLPETVPAAGKTLLVAADPVFDEQDARVQQARRSPQALQVAQRNDGLIKTMAAMEEYGQPSFRRLHFTGRLPGQFKQLYGPNAVEAITGMEVTKQNVGNRLAQPYRYAVLATHGILDNHLPYVQEPALVLTQVTPAVSGNTGAASPDDPLAGFLTLTDVMGLKIPASLVSLTACSTGLGRELTGEGVMNMGRAFQYAGVRHILMTLWSVSEITTVQLTERIFARLKNGQEPLDAVRGARADLRQAGYDHPYFWAPFILVGR